MPLKRVLTLRTIIATGAGLTLATSTFVAAIQVAGFLAGDSAWIPILISGCLCLVAATCFSELNGLLPSAAGIRLYFSKAFNDQLSLAIFILYMIVIMGVVGAESFVLAIVLNEAIPAISPLCWIILMFITVTGLNLRGVKIAGNFQDAITYGLIFSLLAFSFLAFSRVGFPVASFLKAGSLGGLAQAAAVGVFLYVGFEWVVPLAEEVTDSRLISRGMLIAVGILSITYALLTVAMTASVEHSLLANSAAPHIIFARSVLGRFGLIWMVILSIAASITTFNAGMLSISRSVYATAREHALPALFSKINRFFTPWAAILTVFIVGLGISIVTLISRHYLILINMAAAIECIVYVLAGLAVLRLRKTAPGAPRPYRVPGGFLVPLFTSIIFMLLAATIFVTYPWTGVVIALAFLLCWWYVKTIVPVLKKRYESVRPSRRRRPLVDKPNPEACGK